LQSSGQLGRARSIMSKSNENFMGEKFGARQGGSSESGSSYDSSSSDDHNRNQSKKRVIKSRIGVETPIGQIELEPDAFRGAMNPDISSSSANRGNFSNQHLEEQDMDEEGITPGNRYNPNENSSRDVTENLNRKKSQRKHKKGHHSRRNSRKESKRTIWHGMYKEFLAAEPGTNFQDQGLKGVTYTCQLKDNLHAEYLLPRKNNAVVELSEWQKRSVNLLNTQGMALKIFQDNGVYSFPVKMSVDIMENYAEECNFSEDRQFSRQELQEQHFTVCIRNLDACPRNYNMYQSVIFLFHYLMKAAENVPPKNLKLIKTMTTHCQKQTHLLAQSN